MARPTCFVATSTPLRASLSAISLPPNTVHLWCTEGVVQIVYRSKLPLGEGRRKHRRGMWRIVDGEVEKLPR